MKLYTALLVCSCLMLGMACSNKNTKSEEHEETEEHHEEGNTVALNDAQMKAADIQIGTIEMKNLTSSIKVNGTLAVPNQNKALITSLANGVLRTLNVQPGDYVRKGQVIGTIANTELSGVQQQVASLNAQLVYAEQDQKRQKELVAGNAAPLKNLQKVEAEISSLQAQRSALQRQLSALGVSSSKDISSTITLTAPISGTISEVSAQIGSNINASTPIAQIINNSELHLDLFVYEKDLPKVAAGQTIHFTLTNNPGKEYDATIYSIGTAFANESKAIPVHARVVNNKTGLIEGMSVSALISLSQATKLAVPEDAIVSSGGKDYIFLLHPTKTGNTKETTFERVEIVRGTSDVGFSEILPVTDIQAGAKMVVKGAFFLMAKMTNTGGHEH